MKNYNMIKNTAYLLLAFLGLFFFSSANRSTEKCSHLKNGKFYYYAKKTRERIDVSRFDSLQLESVAKKEEPPLRNKIIWKGDCEYDLFINAFSHKPLSEVDSIIAATPANVKIIHIDVSFYVCVARLNIFDKKIELRDTLYFVK
jgi:hypothetical protein